MSSRIHRVDFLPGIANDEGPKNGANSSSRSSDTYGCGASADELGGRVDVRLGGGGGEQLRGLEQGECS